MKLSEASVMKRLLAYMWRYKWLTALALAFTFLTSLLLTAIPLAARWFIDNLVDPKVSTAPVLTALQFLALYYALFVARVLATYLSQMSFARVSNSIVRDIRWIFSGTSKALACPFMTRQQQVPLFRA